MQKYNITTSRSTPGCNKILENDNSEVVDITEYRSMIMGLRYVSANIVPEILFDVAYLATKQSEPRKKQWNEGLQLLQYILGVRQHGIIMKTLNKKGTIYIYRW